MSEDVSRQLQAIADLLRRQVEVVEREQHQREEQRREAQETKEGLFGSLTGGLSKFAFPQTLEESMTQVHHLEEQADQDRQERREFQERLLAELQRHNQILEKILSRLVQE